MGGKSRLDDGIGPFGISYRRNIFFHFLKTACFSEHFLNLLAGDETVLAYQNLSLFIEFSMIVNDIRYRKIVAQTDFIVIDIVGRCNLEATCTESDFHIGVLNDRNLLVNQRDKHFLAFQPMIALVIRVDADCRISHNGLRAGRRNDDIFVRAFSVAIRDIISQMIEMTLGLLMYNFLVADSRMSFRIPVDHAYSPVNQAFLIEIYESVDDGFRQIRIHGELGTVPVA